MVVIKRLISIIILNGFFKSYFCSTACKPKVAIVGTGIGGASTSHFLTKLFKQNLEIDFFESKEIGGRLATVHFGDQEFESGGSIIHPRNKYMKDFVKLLNLSPKNPMSQNVMGIWDGDTMVFRESEWKLFSLLKLVYTYGFQPIILSQYISTILNDFDKIYDLQDHGIGFENVTALLGAMNENFVDLLQVSIKDHLTQLGYGPKLIDELIEATIVVNYGQDTDVHAFVASVSIAGAEFDLWSVKDGNKKVPQLLISKNKNNSIINATVTKIVRQQINELPQYEVFFSNSYKDEKSNLTSKIYDIVILAAPMTSDQENSIDFQGFDNSNLTFMGEFQTTYATFVLGEVNPAYFNFSKDFGGIMSCNPNKTIISSIGQLLSVKGTVDENAKVWKVFSRRKLDDSLLNKMFTKVNEIKEIKWKAYPKYSTSMRFDKFKLDDLMYHVNAIEWAASAMEMSAIGGRNVAILAFKDYQKHCSLRSNNLKEESQTHSSEL